MNSQQDFTVIFANDSYNVTIIPNYDCNTSDDEYFDEDDEYVFIDEEHDIFDDDHPWDTRRERSFRHNPEVWLYGMESPYDVETPL